MFSHHQTYHTISIMVDSDSHVTVVEPNSDQKLDTAVATVLHEISSFQSFAVERDLEDVIERISKSI